MLYNVLDGAYSGCCENRVYAVTTNRLDLLPKGLMRAERFILTEELSYADAQMTIDLFYIKFPVCDKKTVEKGRSLFETICCWTIRMEADARDLSHKNITRCIKNPEDVPVRQK